MAWISRNDIDLSFCSSAAVACVILYEPTMRPMSASCARALRQGTWPRSSMSVPVPMVVCALSSSTRSHTSGRKGKEETRELALGLLYELAISILLHLIPTAHTYTSYL